GEEGSGGRAAELLEMDQEGGADVGGVAHVLVLAAEGVAGDLCGETAEDVHAVVVLQVRAPAVPVARQRMRSLPGPCRSLAAVEVHQPPWRGMVRLGNQPPGLLGGPPRSRRPPA